MKPWNIQDVIKERVNREAEYEHAKDPRPSLPEYVPPQKVSFNAGLYNFIRQLKM